MVENKEEFNSPVLSDQYAKFEFQMIPFLEESELAIVTKGIWAGYPVEVIAKVEHRGEVWCYTESELNTYTGLFQLWFRESEIDYQLYVELFGEEH